MVVCFGEGIGDFEWILRLEGVAAGDGDVVFDGVVPGELVEI